MGRSGECFYFRRISWTRPSVDWRTSRWVIDHRPTSNGERWASRACTHSSQIWHVLGFGICNVQTRWSKWSYCEEEWEEAWCSRRTMTNSVSDRDRNHSKTNWSARCLMIRVECWYHVSISVLEYNRWPVVQCTILNLLGRLVVNERSTDLLNRWVEICSA